MHGEGDSVGKECPCQCRRHKKLGFNPWVGKIPWRRAWQPTPVFLAGESHGQRSLAVHWAAESDTTERARVRTHTHTHTHTYTLAYTYTSVNFVNITQRNTWRIQKSPSPEKGDICFCFKDIFKREREIPLAPGHGTWLDVYEEREI